MAGARQIGRALITGASSGIGWELAWEFARGGYDLVLVARSRKRLQELAGAISKEEGRDAMVMVADLEQSGTAEKIYRQLQQKKVSIDVVVNNAGFGIYGPFSRNRLSQEIAMAQLNMLAPVNLSRLFLPAMLKKGRGGILNVASIAGFLPGPFLSGYNASKAFLLFHTEALSAELAGSGVGVTVLCPGVTETAFFARARVPKRARWASRNRMSAATVARAGYRGFLAGKTIVIPGLQNRLLVLLPRLLPRFLIRHIVRLANNSGQQQER